MAHPKSMERTAVSIAAILLFLAPSCLAQVPVALSPIPRLQFLDPNGHPLAGGKVCTYQAGTTTPAPTYTDATGTILNTNPVRLDSGGFATIYLGVNSYKIVVLDGSGIDGTCNTGVQQWSQDQVSAYQILTQAQSFILVGTTSDPIGTVGQLGYRTDLGRVRFFNGAWDSFPGLNTIDIFTNKTLVSPVITGTVTGGATYASAVLATPIINGASTGTGIQGTSPTLMTASTVAGVGAILCTDATGGATTSACPTASGFKSEGVNVVPVTVGNTVALSPLQTITIPSNDIGSGQTFYVDATGIIGDTGPPTLFIGLYLDGVLISGGGFMPNLAPANSQPWGFRASFTGISTGVAGTVSGAIFLWQSTNSGGAIATNTIGAGDPGQTIVIDTTISHVLQLKVQWGSADALNTITSNIMTVYRIG